MKFKRKASAEWRGTGMDGEGTMSTQSKTLHQTPFSFHSRFKEGKGTNPEELIGAAHAGCFTMQLSFLLSEGGYTPEQIETDATVLFQDGEIPNIHLHVKGKVPNLNKKEFTEYANKAKEICPISKLLDTDITMDVDFSA